MKKVFPCGHKGKGLFCHYCKQLEQQAQQKQKKIAHESAERSAYKDQLKRDSLSLEVLPRHLVSKARRILKRLGQERQLSEFGGKRMRYNRNHISIPIGRDWRLVCHQGQDKIIQPIKILSHEDYNKVHPCE